MYLFSSSSSFSSFISLLCLHLFPYISKWIPNLIETVTHEKLQVYLIYLLFLLHFLVNTFTQIEVATLQTNKANKMKPRKWNETKFENWLSNNLRMMNKPKNQGVTRRYKVPMKKKKKNRENVFFPFLYLLLFLFQFNSR